MRVLPLILLILLVVGLTVLVGLGDRSQAQAVADELARATRDCA